MKNAKSMKISLKQTWMKLFFFSFHWVFIDIEIQELSHKIKITVYVMPV